MLKDTRTGAEHMLAPNTVIGRSSRSEIQIDNEYVSGEHAKLVWTGSAWAARDMGSRNGTFVDRQRLEPGVATLLESGAKIGFGEEEGFELVDASGPVALAKALDDGQVVSSAGELLCLPSAETPWATLYPNVERGTWMFEAESGETQVVKDRQVVEVRGRSWQLILPVVHEATPHMHRPITLDDVTIHFVAKNDLVERVSFVAHGAETELENRGHWRILLHMARLRLREEAGEKDAGWASLKQLREALNLEDSGVNIAVFRGRKQLAAEGVLGAARLIDVKPNLRRFGITRVEIEEA